MTKNRCYLPAAPQCAPAHTNRCRYQPSTSHASCVNATTEPANVRQVCAAARSLAEVVPGVLGVAVVGSWARGAGRPDSDVDLVVLCETPELLLANKAWHALFGDGTELFRAEDFGLLQERRLRRPDGLVVEVCIGARDWAATDPADAGSVRVARDGMRVLFDPHGILAAFVSAAV